MVNYLMAVITVFQPFKIFKLFISNEFVTFNKIIGTAVEIVFLRNWPDRKENINAQKEDTSSR